MEEKLIELVADVLEAEPGALSLDTEFKTDEFDWDSMKGYAILVTLEDEFGASITVDDFIAAKRVGDLLGLVSE
ncbi:MAG: acyl carrier protein [Clostridiales Family XIII bacterium]|jgi:acyl carrier protein|nr:acyl carrier protein [Clostridiales Family XIII bacterium]